MDEKEKQEFTKVVGECADFFSRPQGIDEFSERLKKGKPITQPGTVTVEEPGVNLRDHEGWQARFIKLLDSKSFYHDEPWLTLMALWGIFGRPNSMPTDAHARVVNELMQCAFRRKESIPPIFESSCNAYMEILLPENSDYRDYVKKVLQESPTCYHPYADRHNTLVQKIEDNVRPSLEGNTNLDALIAGRQSGNQPAAVFIEAKFLADISKDISYVAARNQIARNIDCALDVVTDGGKNLDRIASFWFVLLTPGMFRTDKYGGTTATNTNYVEKFQTQRSRFYCFKMDDCTCPKKLFADLPHWRKKLDEKQQAEICRRIGWLTFEDVVNTATQRCLLPSRQTELLNYFFRQRGV